MNKTRPKQIVLATGNPGKLREVQNLLGGEGIEVFALSAFSAAQAEETGLSFVENAILKARYACRASGLPAIADDSGIEVDALNGAPGIYSARFAGAEADDDKNNRKLLQELDGVKGGERSARYQCVLVYMRHAEDPVPLIAQGSWEGEILLKPQGEGGFGYDPLFWLTDLQKSAAQLKQDEKNRISHRAKAMRDLLKKLENRR